MGTTGAGSQCLQHGSRGGRRAGWDWTGEREQGNERPTMLNVQYSDNAQQQQQRRQRRADGCQVAAKLVLKAQHRARFAPTVTAPFKSGDQETKTDFRTSQAVRDFNGPDACAEAERNLASSRTFPTTTKQRYLTIPSQDLFKLR